MSLNDLPLFILRLFSAQFLAFGTVYLAYTLSYHLLGRSTVARRWCATALIGMWLTSALFHSLLALGQFKLAVVLSVLGILVFIMLGMGNPYHLFLRRLSRDLTWLLRVWKLNQRSRYRWLVYVFSLFALVKCIRASLLPPLGWDSLTYHAVKAAVWVQIGQPASMQSPGGWSSYRSFFAGGEIFTAWAMLPFQSDLLVGLVDPLQWLFLGMALYALGRELGLRARYAWMGTIYILSLPAVHLLVGSGYSDLGTNLALLSSLLFAAHFRRHHDGASALLSIVALGLACGIKVTALPSAAVVFAIMAWPLVKKKNRWVTLRWVMAGSLAASVLVLPWTVYNIQWTGYPLSPLPLSIGGLTLGESNPTLRWYQDLLHLQPYTWEAEMEGLSWVVRSPVVPSLHLSAATLVPVALFLLTFWSYLRRKPASGLLCLGFIGSLMLSYYSPSFSVVRVHFGEYNGRFLFPVAAVVVLLSLCWCRHQEIKAHLYILFLGLGTILHIAGGVFYGWAPFERVAIPVALVLLLVLISFLPRRPPSQRLLVGTILLVPLLIVPPLAVYKNASRYSAAKQSDLMHPTDKYWALPAQLLDSPEEPKRIAVTAGPWQKADNWAMYFFMGRQLQNRLFYVPVSQSGEIIDFGPQGVRERYADFGSWIRRLLDEKITHVMCFHPASIEMLWMEFRPDLFERVVGVTGYWGLYRIKG